MILALYNFFVFLVGKFIIWAYTAKLEKQNRDADLEYQQIASLYGHKFASCQQRLLQSHTKTDLQLLANDVRHARSKLNQLIDAVLVKGIV